MASFAIINSENKVINLVKVDNSITTVGEKEEENLGVKYLESIKGTNNTYVQYFYDSQYPAAKIGDTYDPETQTFEGSQPFPSWNFNTTTRKWDAPKPRPVSVDIVCYWSERNQCWYTEEVFKKYAETFEGTDDQCFAFLFQPEVSEDDSRIWSKRTLSWYTKEEWQEYAKTFEGTEEESFHFLFNSEAPN